MDSKVGTGFMPVLPPSNIIKTFHKRPFSEPCILEKRGSNKRALFVKKRHGRSEKGGFSLSKQWFYTVRKVVLHGHLGCFTLSKSLSEQKFSREFLLRKGLLLFVLWLCLLPKNK